jgi:poly-gamma-glutamate synthesis protein (capsule biosynthesis protein)
VATIAFLGDLMLGRGVDEELSRREPRTLWGDVLPLLRSADAVVANLECALTTRGAPWTATPKVFHFRARPGASIAALRAANVRCVSLANNHVLDYGAQGLLETTGCLDRAGIAHAGAGCSEREAAAPAIFDAAGLRVGVIALTDNEPPFAATASRPGTLYTPIDGGEPGLRKLSEPLAAARSAGCGVIVLSVHWGPNMTTRPPGEFRGFARAAIDAGVAVVHGHSAHVFQAVEGCGGGLVLYDTGDFLDDYAVDPVLRNDWSFVFLVELEGARLTRLRMVPVRLEYALVRLARGEERQAICARMEELCAELGVRPRRTPEGLELRLRGELSGPGRR